MAKGSSIDFSKFKKQSSDGKTVTLRHPHGHSITVALGPLSPKMRKQFEDLPSHNAEKPHYYDAGYVSADDPQNTESTADPQQDQTDAPPPAAPTAPGQTPAPDPTEPAPDPTPGVEQRGFGDSAKAAAAAAPGAINWLLTGKSGQPATPGAVAPVDSSDTPPSAIDPTPKSPDTPQNADPYGMNAYAEKAQQGYQEQRSAEQEMADAQGKAAQAQAKQQGAAAQAQEKLAKSYHDSYTALDTERLALKKEVEQGMINPNHFWNSRGQDGQPGKLQTVIGALIGGLGGSDVIDTLVNRDIEAQKTNLGAKQSLLEANLHQFGNLRDATDMTRVMLNDAASYHIKQAALKSTNAVEQARAHMAIGKLDSDNAGLTSQIAMRRMMMGGGAQGPLTRAQQIQMLRMQGPEGVKQSEFLEQHTVEGVPGTSSQKIEAGDRKELEARQKFDSAVTDLQSFMKNKKTSGFSLADRATAQVKAANISSLFREMTNGGVFKSGEQEFIGSTVDPNPVKVFNFLNTAGNRLEEARKENLRDRAVKLRTLGFQAGSSPQGVQGTGGPTVRGPRFKPVR